MLYLDSKPLTYSTLLYRAKKLTVGLSRTGGRNNFGRITSFRKGGGRFRRLYKFVDFWRRLKSVGFVLRVESDSFRSATLSLVLYQTGFLSYVILPEFYIVGDKINIHFNESLLSVTDNQVPYLENNSFEGFNSSVSNNEVLCTVWGNALPLSDIPVGSLIYNIELYPLKGAQICRSAGSSAVLVNRRETSVTVKLRSGWKLVLSSHCYATIGVSPNLKHIYNVYRKAGTLRNFGRKPTVRGVAMNAIDHPHGGGRGKTSGGPRPLTPWGRITKQQPTVFKKFRTRLSHIRFR